MPDKHYRVKLEIDVWDDTPSGAAFQAAGYAEKAAMRSVYQLQEMRDDEPVGMPVEIDLEEVLFEGEKQ